MMELIFVIVVIGILAAVALPRLLSGISDAELAKAKSEIATVRSGISSAFSKNIMAGDSDKCPPLEKSTTDGYVFEGVLSTPIKENSGDVKWKLDQDTNTYNTYTLTIDSQSATFKYEKDPTKDCPFTCVSGTLCSKLQ
jgi:general secretion pathway protein G